MRKKLNIIYKNSESDFDIQKSYDLSFFQVDNYIFVIKTDETGVNIRDKKPIELYVIKDYKGYYVICKINIVNPLDDIKEQVIDIKTVNSKLADDDIILQLTGNIHSASYTNIAFRYSKIKQNIDNLN